MADFNISNRAKTIRIATLSGLYPVQCRKSGSIMFSNGVQSIFIPEKRNFSHDEEVANVVSLCNANGIEKETVDKYVSSLKEGNKEEVYNSLSEELISKFSKETPVKRHNRANFIEGVAYTQKYTDILEKAGIEAQEVENVVAQLFADSRSINAGERELFAEENANEQ